jgi:dTDP-4-dehydrorhamnose 3,5-epimerase
MQIEETSIPDVFIIKPKILGDERGYFLESYREEWFNARGLNVNFVQNNISRSQKGALRGLHYQIRNPQDKLVMVTHGEVLDVAVDIRQGSPTFGKFVMHRLSAENRHLMFIPGGFAHGFQVITETADFAYKCSNYYDKDGERGLFYNDPEIGIPWEEMELIVSQRDKELPLLKEIASEDLPIFG